MINLAGTPRILKRRKVLDQLLNRHRRPPFVDEGRTVTPRYTVKSHQPISCVAPGINPVRTCRNPLLTMIETASFASRTRHLLTSLSPTITGSIDLRLRRVLDESWDGSDGSDTAAECASGAQPDRELPRPGWLGGVRILCGIVGERRAWSPRRTGPIQGRPGSTSGRAGPTTGGGRGTHPGPSQARVSPGGDRSPCAKA